MATRRNSYAFRTLAGLLLPLMISAAPFVPPQEGPVAFRRDRLPIDVDTMIGLSDELIVLAQGQATATAENRRNAARILALSLALNPANPSAREAITKLSGGKPLQKPEKRDLNRSQARIWHVLTWLQMPEAGADGLALGACLGDVIAEADPDHPKAAALRDAGQKGAWANWVPELGAYEEPQVANLEKVEEKMTPESPAPAPAGEEAKIVLSTASVTTPLWITDKATGNDVLKAVPVTMTAAIVPPVEGVPAVRPMTFSIDGTPENGPVIRTNRSVQTALVQRFGKLPADSRVTLSLGEETPYLVVKNREAISGAATVLSAAAISGHEPAGIVIGKINPDGTFTSVPDLWDRLRAISKGPGGRLVIPQDAAEMLPAILALEDPDFFLRYDVLYASNLAELMERSVKATTSPLTELLSRFQDVRAKGTGVPIGQYVANRFVRQRLVELSSEASYFASPRMLAIQAAGERPIRVSRKILAFELRRAIEPIAWIQGKSSAEIDLSQLDKSYELARAEVDKLERYIDTKDRDLFASVRDMTTTLRTFSRAMRVGANRENGPAIVAEASDGMRKSYTAVLTEIRNSTGEREVPETPEP